MTGTVFSIEEFSVYDGPGIRTTVFLKGCPLRCNWCHNPEGLSQNTTIVRSPNGCIHCDTCLKSATFKDGEIVFTEDSMKNCPRNLLRVCGETFSPDELCRKILKNKNILSNGGGVTFSGGEPFMQSSFLLECLKNLNGKLHKAIQTSGFCKPDIFNSALRLTDYFLFDLKLANADMHKKYTGVSNEIILQNFSSLAVSGTDFVVRIPLIPGVTDTEENIIGISKILKDNNVSYAELLPYNKMAGAKYKMAGRSYSPAFDENSPINPQTQIFNYFGINAKVL